MMRRLIAYLAAVILTVSCTAELVQRDRVVESSLEGAPVTITFSVPDIPVLPATKSLSDGDGDITGTPYQYIKAAGQGNVAALSAVNYLNSIKGE